MKVPLLEYIDKLEADTRKADALATMHRPHANATLALIAKLREAVSVVQREAKRTGVEKYENDVSEWMTIEVPE